MFEYPDRSERAAGGCDDLVVEGPTTCLATFYVLRELQEGRLALTTYGDALPGARPAAGVTTVEF